MNYAALSASNGSGEAARPTVTAARLVGGTTITVNTTSNWPTGTFIATTGTLAANGTIISSTAQVFYGTVASTTSLTITSFAPGYSDVGNAINDVVVLKPTTEWANIVASQLDGSIWKYLGYSYTPTGLTVTGTTPTAWSGMSVEAIIPSSLNLVKISVCTRDAYNSIGGDNEIRVYKGASSGALTTLVGGIQINTPSGTSIPVDFFVVDVPAANSTIYYTVALVATSSAATITAEVGTAANIIVEVA